MSITTKVVSAGVTLALFLNASGVQAQVVPSGNPASAPAAVNRSPAPPPSSSGQRRSAADITRNREVAERYGLPTDLLTSEEDRWGRPIPRTIEESIQELGVEGARLRATDDAQFCSDLTEISELNAQIHQADLAVVRAQEAVAAARTNAERRMAEAQLGRARNNLFQLLGMVVRLGLAAAIPGAGWAYGGYILVSEVTQLSSRNQHNRELATTNAMNGLFLAMTVENSLRLRALDLRLKQYDRRGALWDRSMKGWCDAQAPFHTPLLSTTSSYTPAPTSE
jgi:hypothetical protein